MSSISPVRDRGDHAGIADGVDGELLAFALLRGCSISSFFVARRKFVGRT
jgi:hypothetical protein